VYTKKALPVDGGGPLEGREGSERGHENLDMSLTSRVMHDYHIEYGRQIMSRERDTSTAIDTDVEETTYVVFAEFDGSDIRNTFKF